MDSTADLASLCRSFAERSPRPMAALAGSRFLVQYVNEPFVRLARAVPDDLLGRPFADAVPEAGVNGCAAALDRVYRTGVPETLAEQPRGADGGVGSAYWSYDVWPIVGPGDGRPAGVMVEVTDATEAAVFRARAAAMNESLLVSALRQHELAAEASQKLTDHLQAALREKEYFIAVLSHELRTPLNPVLVAAAMLERDPRIDPDTRDILRMMHRNVALEARLIDDLLDLTRLERGKLQLDRRPVDLRAVVEAAVEVCRADLEVGGLVLDVDAGARPQVVDADASRLQQVFSNLLRNAIKFTPPGGRVSVRARCDGEACEVRVADTGAGIDPAFLPRAFGAFEQGDRGHARKAGLGLGLAICKTIMDLHDGTIAATSEGTGRGATFVVWLPTAVGACAEPAEPADAVPADDGRPVKPLRILLVEDHADTARIMRRLLALDGHDVRWAANVHAGVTLAATHDFDLLLSDLGLPDGTGVDLIQTLRRAGSTLPGIILSGYGQDQDRDRTRDAGFAAHLVKPLNLPDLRDAIATVVGH